MKISASLPYDLNMVVEKIANLKDISKSFFIKRAVKDYILELAEDEEDLREIEAFEASGGTYETISLEEIERRLGL